MYPYAKQRGLRQHKKKFVIQPTTTTTKLGNPNLPFWNIAVEFITPCKYSRHRGNIRGYPRKTGENNNTKKQNKNSCPNTKFLPSWNVVSKCSHIKKQITHIGDVGNIPVFQSTVFWDRSNITTNNIAYYFTERVPVSIVPDVSPSQTISIG